MRIPTAFATTFFVFSAVDTFALPVANDDTYTPDAAVYTVAAPEGWLANDTTTDGGLTVTSAFAPAQGTLTANSDGSFTYTPDFGQAVNTTIQYSIKDNSGNTDSAFVTFDLVSTLPGAVDDTYTPDAVTFNVSAPQGALSNDTGGIGELTVFSATAPTEGGLFMTNDGALTYTLDNGQTANQTITYFMRDEAGRTDSATITFDVASTLPGAVDDTYTPDAVTFTVSAPQGALSNDTGGIGQLSVFSATAPSEGALFMTNDGALTYTLDNGQTTNQTITYFIEDEAGRTDSATITFDVASTLPGAVDDTYTLNAATLNVGAPQGVLSNDTGGIGGLSVLSATAPSEGLLFMTVDGGLSYSLEFGQTTNQTVTYFVEDEAGRTDSATITFDVAATLPLAADDFFSMFSNQLLNVTGPGLLENDFGVIGELEVVSFSQLSDGLLTLLADGSFMFDPNAGFFGTTSFDYTIADELGRLSTATVFIDVAAVPLPSPLLLLLAGAALIVRARQKRVLNP